MALDKLLVICGPTATGKTALALSLAKKFSGELVSADSRQIYEGLDFLTGKDLPRKFKVKNSKLKVQFKNKNYSLNTYLINNVPLWLYDAIEPWEEFSVAHYQCLARKVISDIQKRGKLPIVVGGTGLYIASLVKPLLLLHIPPNKSLRQRLGGADLAELQQKLVQIDPLKWKKMNYSDRQNPCRLVRAIEVALFPKSGGQKLFGSEKTFAALWIGLTAAWPTLRNRIKVRVRQRWARAVAEVKALRKASSKLTPQAASILGMAEINHFLSDHSTEEAALKAWVGREWAYARRQMTWFKKESSINWFDITQPSYQREVVTRVAAWYTEN